MERIKDAWDEAEAFLKERRQLEFPKKRKALRDEDFYWAAGKRPKRAEDDNEEAYPH